jgi:hypothetical protein
MPQPPAALQVVVTLDPEDPEAKSMFEAALREELIQLVNLLPPDKESSDAGVLRVAVEPVGRSKVVGELVEKGVGSISNAADQGSRQAELPTNERLAAVGVLGVVALPVSAAVGSVWMAGTDVRLGYKPRHLKIQVEYDPPPDQPMPVPMFETNAFEVTSAMRSLSKQEQLEPNRIRMEEGRALARVVSKHLRDAGWAVKVANSQ